MENVERNQKAKAGVTYCMVLEAGSERRKKPDMTTGEHVRVPCRGVGDSGVGGGYLTRLRAIKSLLVYFLKCRDWRSYISRPLGTASSGQGSTKGSL